MRQRHWAERRRWEVIGKQCCRREEVLTWLYVLFCLKENKKKRNVCVFGVWYKEKNLSNMKLKGFILKLIFCSKSSSIDKKKSGDLWSSSTPRWTAPVSLIRTAFGSTSLYFYLFVFYNYIIKPLISKIMPLLQKQSHLLNFFQLSL